MSSRSIAVAELYNMPGEDWLALFHAGDRATLEACYREYLPLVMGAVGSVVAGADQETVVHEVFLGLLSKTEMRTNFSGGSFTSWLRTVARNRAIDFVRRYQRETRVEPGVAAEMAGGVNGGADTRAEVRDLLDRFLRTEVPEKWHAVFHARFVERLSQREAAAKLGLRRTTLAYQEERLRARLRKFVLREAP